MLSTSQDISTYFIMLNFFGCLRFLWLIRMIFFFLRLYSCWRASRSLFHHWLFLPYQLGETLIYERFWSLLTFSTRHHEKSTCWSSSTSISGVQSRWWNGIIYMDMGVQRPLGWTRRPKRKAKQDLGCRNWCFCSNLMIFTLVGTGCFHPSRYVLWIGLHMSFVFTICKGYEEIR